MLSSEEIADFEKFVLSMIPPELFNLYFFDGEKIADFFMNEGSNARIKEAFLTLCGYDTFDIMRRNFKRISGGSSTSAPALDAYWEAKQEAEQAQRMYQSLLRDLSECEDAIATCEADIAALEKAYAEKASFSCTAAFSSLLFHEQRGLRKGGFFTRSPMGDGMDMVDMAWAVLADIACSIHEQAVNLQELTGNHPNEIFGCGGGFQSPTLCQMLSDLCGVDVVLRGGFDQATLMGLLAVCNATMGEPSYEASDQMIRYQPRKNQLIHEYQPVWKENRNRSNGVQG